MAIDNNTSYELTGAQVKDLAQKIRNKADDNVFVGSSSSVAGSKGLVPQPQAGDNTKFLSGDGTWKTVSGGGETAAHKLTIGANEEYGWDPVVCPVSHITRGIYVYDSDVQGPLDVIQLVQWVLRGDDFVITGTPEMGNYGKYTPIKAMVDVAGNYDFDPTNPQVSQIASLQIRFHVADSGPWKNPTIPRVPFEYDAVLLCTDPTQSDLEWAATVYQGNTLPLFYEAQLEEGASFTWESLVDARVVQGVNTPSTNIQDVLTNNAFPVTNSEILQRIISALFAGKTISVKAIVNTNNGYFALAGVEFDRFMIESTEGYYNLSDAYTVCDAIYNERAKLYLYASSDTQGLVVQFFGKNITVSGS